MKVRVIYFGMLKDAVGGQIDEVTLPDGATLGDLVEDRIQHTNVIDNFRKVLAFSVNQEYAQLATVLKDSDEVAMLPPVSGGKGARCQLVRTKIDAQRIADEIKDAEDGAVSVFDGIVRNNTRGRRTLYLEYESYEEMALKQMEHLAGEAIDKFGVRDVRIVHRLGRLEISETSVFIAVASAHRAAAMDACRWLIDTLKKTVPIWKKEYFEDGAVWADGEPFPDTLRPATEKAFMRRLILFALLTITAFAQDSVTQNKKDDQQPTFRVEVKLVDVFTTVTDQNGAPITDLKKEEFRIVEDGVAQKIALFEQQSEAPLSIVLCIDASQSVGKDLKIEAEAARKFAASILRPVDKLALYQFSEIVREVVPFTSDIRRVNRGIQNVRLGSGTALYDAIYLGGQMLAKREGRKVLVVITDGGDTMSSVDYHEAVRAAQQSDALVYSIIDVPIAASAGRNTGGEHALIQLSRDTGGKHYYADTAAGIEKVFEQISRELRTQYLLGYYPVHRLAGTDFRHIEVKIERGGGQSSPPANASAEAGDGPEPPVTGFRVRHRSGYYTSKLE